MRHSSGLCGDCLGLVLGGWGLYGWGSGSTGLCEVHHRNLQPFLRGCEYTLDSKKLGHGCRMVPAGLPSFFGLKLESGHVFHLVEVYCWGSYGGAPLPFKKPKELDYEWYKW